MSRIDLTDNGMDILIKMADGNPGAISAMTTILKEHDAIDPQAVMGGIGTILILDTWEIYGSDIYVLFNDKCGCDVRRLLMLMRATQLGFFSHSKLQQMAADQARKINLTEDEFKALDDQVCNQLKDFKKVA